MILLKGFCDRDHGKEDQIMRSMSRLRRVSAVQLLTVLLSKSLPPSPAAYGAIAAQGEASPESVYSDLAPERAARPAQPPQRGKM